MALHTIKWIATTPDPTPSEESDTDLVSIDNLEEGKTSADKATLTVQVPTGTLLSDAARLAGLDIGQPCGGQGRCGRCAVQVLSGDVRRRSVLRLSAEDVSNGFALACQSIVEGDAVVELPPQEVIASRLTTDRRAVEISPPAGYNPLLDQSLRRCVLQIKAPRLDDQTDDWSRIQTALRQQAGLDSIGISLPLLRRINGILRGSDTANRADMNEENEQDQDRCLDCWEVTAVVDLGHEPLDSTGPKTNAHLISLIPGRVFDDEPLWGAAIDIGTTTVTLWLVDLTTGEVRAQVSEYNGQIARGEDVISRIIYASKNGGGEEMQQRVVDSINRLVETACLRTNSRPEDILRAVVSGNSTMIHLLLNLPASSIRLAPYVTTINQPPILAARELGLHLNPEAMVDCLPGVASYVGADITAGVYSSGMDNTEKVTLFLDVGTNGEMVMGNREWLVTCACSAGPAFEGAGVLHGMRATRGAIEEVWINAEAGDKQAYTPTYRVIGGGRPAGLCGSGLISLIAEMLITGVLDRAGGINLALAEITPRIRQGDHGSEYVIAWANESSTGRDIAITNVDIDNLKRAKAAIYAGYTVLAQSVGVPLEMVEQFLIGGSFGKYINVEKAVQIGLLPDMEWERFQFLGNTSVRGSYYALLEPQARNRISDIARRMTYIELSADNSFYDAFMSAMFLPHTDMSAFPSVAEQLARLQPDQI